MDLHARNMCVCILNQAGEVLVHRNVKACPEAFLEIVAPYREDLVVAVSCIFTGDRLADLCAGENIAFVPGHVLTMGCGRAATPSGNGNALMSNLRDAVDRGEAQRTVERRRDRRVRPQAHRAEGMPRVCNGREGEEACDPEPLM